ncbi:hypothetical protein F0237_17075 [Vibrio tubiashii]|uniref:Uncharacterized protein n=1 Tax=Vibrio tubiashii TaxID=29498 RepID=A0AAE5LJ57_9VIBR|nr:hypothetical protein [Vibrio tubiashii]
MTNGGQRCRRNKRARELESWRAGELESWRAGELESWRNYGGLTLWVNLCHLDELELPAVHIGAKPNFPAGRSPIPLSIAQRSRSLTPIFPVQKHSPMVN